MTRLGQFAGTGEWRMKREGLLAGDIRRGPHAFVLDLGSGRSQLLDHLEPDRYVGLDLGAADLEWARRRHARPGYEFIVGNFLEMPLERWAGADVVTASAVFHHLSDDEVVSLAGRLEEEVAPSRLVFTDGVTVGPLKGLMTSLDAGEPSRPRESLYELFRPRFAVTETWTYLVPFRTFRYFGFELTPRS